jgi:hypothetical protein
VRSSNCGCCFGSCRWRARSSRSPTPAPSPPVSAPTASPSLIWAWPETGTCPRCPGSPGSSGEAATTSSTPTCTAPASTGGSPPGWPGCGPSSPPSTRWGRPRSRGARSPAPPGRCIWPPSGWARRPWPSPTPSPAGCGPGACRPPASRRSPTASRPTASTSNRPRAPRRGRGSACPTMPSWWAASDGWCPASASMCSSGPSPRCPEPGCCWWGRARSGRSWSGWRGSSGYGTGSCCPARATARRRRAAVDRGRFPGCRGCLPRWTCSPPRRARRRSASPCWRPSPPDCPSAMSPARRSTSCPPPRHPAPAASRRERTN